MKAHHPSTKPTKMTVTEAMAAYRDGTFEKKTTASAEHRQKDEPKTTGGVQKGRDLYESMHNKKEQ